MREPRCPRGLSWLHPGQEDSVLRAECGAGSVPRVTAGTEVRPPPLPVPGSPWCCSWTWERVSSLLWPHSGPPKVPPDLLPGSFSGYHRGQDSSSPPESISCCCLYTSIRSASRGMLLRGDRGTGASPESWPLSLPHANPLLCLCTLTRPAWCKPGGHRLDLCGDQSRLSDQHKSVWGMKQTAWSGWVCKGTEKAE